MARWGFLLGHCLRLIRMQVLLGLLLEDEGSGAASCLEVLAILVGRGQERLLLLLL